MLTESEREWLEDREWFHHPYTCKWCDRYDPLLFFPANKSIPCTWYKSCPSLNCPSQSDLLDALEFSERVAARLTDWLAQDMGCFVCGEKICKLKTKDRSCREKLLKAAYLQVEMEMDI